MRGCYDVHVSSIMLSLLAVVAANPIATFETSMGSFTAEIYVSQSF